MTAPLVSVCVPNLNKRPYLERRMDSVLAQTNADWEIVVCDSFSDDGSWELLQKYAGDPRVHLHQVPRAGMYAGWNDCLARARGKYIHVATSDDEEAPRFQEALLNLLEAHDDYALAYSAFDEIDQESRPWTEPNILRTKFYADPAGPVRRDRRRELFLSLGVWAPWVTLSAVIFRRDLLQKTGSFRRDVGLQGDLPFAWEALLHTDTLHVPEPLAHWRRYPEQATSTAKTMERSAWDVADLIQVALPFMKRAALPWPAEDVMSLRRHVWREYGGLNRQYLRRDFRKFRRALEWAWAWDRGYLARQLLNGFGFPREVYGRSFYPAQWFEARVAEFQLPDQQPL
jgi:glycosyltransferase involved in cell wall biosynthesis